MKNKGFINIVLATIISILFFIVLPAYRDFIHRKNVIGGLNCAEAYKKKLDIKKKCSSFEVKEGVDSFEIDIEGIGDNNTFFFTKKDDIWSCKTNIGKKWLSKDISCAEAGPEEPPILMCRVPKCEESAKGNINLTRDRWGYLLISVCSNAEGSQIWHHSINESNRGIVTVDAMYDDAVKSIACKLKNPE